MKEIFKKIFFTQFTTTQLYLIVGNSLLVFFLILLFNLGILPFKSLGDFLFFTFLFLFFALYRPGWAFLFFIGTVVLENINLAPVNLGIAVRPYQFFGALVILAILVRLVARRLSFSLGKPKWYDMLVIAAVIGGFVSALGSPDSALSFKLSVIFSSFAALYFLVRNYVRDIEDLKKIMPVFLGSSLLVVFYAIWQNMMFAQGLIAYEVMPGRPNATFTEADWLGIFLVLVIAIAYSIIYFKQNSYNQIEKKNRWKEFVVAYVFLTLLSVALILTVSRSAWLGASLETVIFLAVVLTGLNFKFKEWQWKIFFTTTIRVGASLLLGIAVVYFFNLTSFQLFNRAKSLGSGLQKITIACPGNADVAMPQTVQDEKEFTLYGCGHINLEEITSEKLKGNVIYEIYRPDPNVNIRKEIYGKSWLAIKKNPLLGIGWGSIGKILGTDERGASLNASNIFLEIWLGAGFLGFLAFVAFWAYILLRNILSFVNATSSEEQAYALFVIGSWFGLTIVNLFNAGIMLGFVWLYMAVAMINLKTKTS